DDDYIGGVATDATGNPSIHGWTESYNGIASLGSHKPTKPGVGTYTFLARFNSSGVRQWGTYYNLITTGINNITPISVDTTGNLYVTGWTLDTTGVATSGAFQFNKIGGSSYDAFIGKF